MLLFEHQNWPGKWQIAACIALLDFFLGVCLWPYMICRLFLISESGSVYS